MIREQVKKYRTKAGWSQQKLAEKAGLSYNVITKIEQGNSKKPALDTIIKIAQAFDITLDELVKTRSKKNNNK